MKICYGILTQFIGDDTIVKMASGFPIGMGGWLFMWGYKWGANGTWHGLWSGTWGRNE